MDQIIEDTETGIPVGNEDNVMVHVLYAGNAVCRFNYHDKEYTLLQNEFYHLPADSDFVRSLIGQGRLEIQ